MVKEISVNEAQTMLENDAATLVDVRTTEEFDLVKLKYKSINISIEKIASKYELIPKNKPVLTLCHLGIRSLSAADFLEKKGYDAISIKGGINEWSSIDDSVKKYVWFQQGNKVIVNFI